METWTSSLESGLAVRSSSKAAIWPAAKWRTPSPRTAAADFVDAGPLIVAAEVVAALVVVVVVAVVVNVGAASRTSTSHGLPAIFASISPWL